MKELILDVRMSNTPFKNRTRPMETIGAVDDPVVMNRERKAEQEERT